MPGEWPHVACIRPDGGDPHGAVPVVVQVSKNVHISEDLINASFWDCKGSVVFIPYLSSCANEGLGAAIRPSTFLGLDTMAAMCAVI